MRLDRAPPPYRPYAQLSGQCMCQHVAHFMSYDGLMLWRKRVSAMFWKVGMYIISSRWVRTAAWWDAPDVVHKESMHRGDEKDGT